MNSSQQRRQELQNHKKDFEKKLEEAKGHVKIVMENEMSGGMEPEMLGMGGDMAMMGLMDRGGHGRANKQKNRRQHMT